MLPLLSLEFDSQRRSKSFGDGSKGVRLRALDAGACLAGVTGEVGGKILRRCEAGAVQENSAEVFHRSFTEQSMVFGMAGNVPKGGSVFRNEKGLATNRFASFPRIQRKAAIVRKQDLAVVFKVAAHLRSLRELEQVVINRFHLQHATLGLEIEKGSLVRALPKFLGGKEPTVGKPGPAVRGMDDCGDLRLQRATDFVQQI